MNLKNTLIKKAACLFKPKSNPYTDRFLCVSTTALGDTLWATPAIRALRETYPHAYIGVLTSTIGHELLLKNPDIDELFIYSQNSAAFLALYRQLKKRFFSHAIIFHTSQRLVLPLVSLLGCTAIIGNKGMHKGLDTLLTHAIPWDLTTHEIQRRLNLVAQLQAYSPSVDLQVHYDPEDDLQAKTWLQTLNLPTYIPRIVFHPGSKDAFKQWPASQFIELGNRLIARLGCALFVTGTNNETHLIHSIVSQIPGAIAVTHLPVRSFAALIKTMHLMITNDTGALHVSLAVNTPTIALFCPTNPEICGPYRAKKVKVINKLPTCTPCLKKKCTQPFCLLQIGVQEVYDAALTFM